VKIVILNHATAKNVTVNVANVKTANVVVVNIEESLVALFFVDFNFYYN